MRFVTLTTRPLETQTPEDGREIAVRADRILTVTEDRFFESLRGVGCTVCLGQGDYVEVKGTVSEVVAKVEAALQPERTSGPATASGGDFVSMFADRLRQEPPHA